MSLRMELSGFDLDKLRKNIRNKFKDIENSDDISKIRNMVNSDQEHILTEIGNFWQVSLLIDRYFIPLQNKVDRVTAEILNYFVEGRPLIGKIFDSDWNYYLYLNNKEIGKLLESINKYSIMMEDPVGCENFCDQFRNSLNKIYENNKDLWCFYD